MVGGTSDTDRDPRSPREILRFGTIVVVGGGCYGSYYVRQLARAERAGAMSWDSLLVVDRDPDCAVSRLHADEQPPAMQLVTDAWEPFFREWLDRAAAGAAACDADAIVPSPLMPHLMADWLLARAQARWPERRIRTAPLAAPPDVPWQRAGEDGTHYVSFAEWMCPINCIEPARCPHTRGERTWSMPPALATYAERERVAGRPVAGPFVFHCSHRAYGVGMIDVRDVVAADAELARLGAMGAVSALVGTASHCHGAVRMIEVGALARFGEWAPGASPPDSSTPP